MQSLALHVPRVGNEVDCIAILDLVSTFSVMFFLLMLYWGLLLFSTVRSTATLP
jgi:hypothetical protein